MERKSVCFLQGSKKTYVTKHKAAEYVREGYAIWKSDRCIVRSNAGRRVKVSPLDLEIDGVAVAKLPGGPPNGLPTWQREYID